RTVRRGTRTRPGSAPPASGEGRGERSPRTAPALRSRDLPRTCRRVRSSTPLSTCAPRPRATRLSPRWRAGSARRRARADRPRRRAEHIRQRARIPDPACHLDRCPRERILPLRIAYKSPQTSKSAHHPGPQGAVAALEGGEGPFEEGNAAAYHIVETHVRT